jgi:hypothetical protein
MKAIVEFGYRKYVVDAAEVTTYLKLLAGGERYSKNWKPKEEGGPTYHVWKDDSDEQSITVEYITDELYHIAKMAGKSKES